MFDDFDGRSSSELWLQPKQRNKLQDATPVMRHVGWLMLPHPAQVLTIKSVNLVTSYKPILAIWLAGAPPSHFCHALSTGIRKKKQGYIGCMFAFLRGPCNFNLGGWKIAKSRWCTCFLRVAHCSRRAHWSEAGIWSQHCWGAKPKLMTAQVGTAKWGLCFLYLWLYNVRTSR